jgi:hypothetical protein
VTLDEIKRNIRTTVSGLSHSQREGLALDLAGVAAGEDVQFLKCDRGTLSAWIQKPGTGPLSDAERRRKEELSGRVGRLTDEDSKELVGLLDRSEAQRSGPRAALAEFPHGGKTFLNPDELVDLAELLERARAGLLTPEGEARLTFLLDKKDRARQGMSRYRRQEGQEGPEAA